MRSLLVVVFALAGAAFGQSLTEVGAAAAGSAAGAAAGKKVSEGISNIFGKVDEQTKDAAKGKDSAKQKEAAKAAPAASPAPASSTASVAPLTGTAAASSPAGGSAPSARTASAKPRPARATVAKADQGLVPSPDPVENRDSVPPPPTLPVRRAAVVMKAEVPVLSVAAAPALPPPPPLPQMTQEDLKTLTLGTRREELLKFGAPASRITMIDDGHLLEIYHYASRDTSFGIVRLNDGLVASVDLR